MNKTIVVKDYNSTYPISSVIGVSPGNDHRQGRCWILEQGGGVPNMEETTYNDKIKVVDKLKL